MNRHDKESICSWHRLIDRNVCSSLMAKHPVFLGDAETQVTDDPDARRVGKLDEYPQVSP